MAVPDRAYAKETGRTGGAQAETGQTEAAQAETAQGDALSEELVFQDFEADTLDSSASGTLTTEEYHRGKQALCYHRNNGNNWWDVTFASATGGTVDMSVSLSDFSSDNVDKTAITKVGFWDDPEAVYYFDDITFVKELPPDESTPMNGTPVKLCDFETDSDGFYEPSASETAASVEEGAGRNGSRGLVYERTTKSAGPSKEAGSVVFGSKTPADITGLRYLVFWIKDMNGSNNPMIGLVDADGNESNFSWTDGGYLKSVKGTWTQFHVPLSTVSGNVDRTKITGVRIGEWNQGTYYIDDVYFDNYLSTGIPGSGDYTVPSVAEREVKASEESGYYTTDGSEPDRDDKTGTTQAFIKPMLVTESTTFKAAAYDSVTGEKNEASTLTYTITQSGRTKAVKQYRQNTVL